MAPSVVIFSCKAPAAMLLNEASIRAGASSTLPLLGRPSCMALPAALAHGTVTTLGCIGNRVYTNLGADEMYIVVPGAKIDAVSDALGIITTANATLEEFARGRAGFAVHYVAFSGIGFSLWGFSPCSAKTPQARSLCHTDPISFPGLRRIGPLP